MTTAPTEFARIFETCYDDLLAYAIRRVDNPADAADVVAETFAIAWEKCGHQTIANIRPWLFGVARNVVRSWRRGELKQVAVADQLRADIVERSRQLTPTDLHLDVLRAMATLSDDDHEVIALSAWEGLSHREIATALGIRPTTARVRLHRARRKLNAALSTPAASPSGSTPPAALANGESS